MDLTEAFWVLLGSCRDVGGYQSRANERAQQSAGLTGDGGLTGRSEPSGESDCDETGELDGSVGARSPFGPGDGSAGAEVDAARLNEAARIIFSELGRLAQRIRVPDESVRDEIVQQTLFKLMGVDKRGLRNAHINEAMVRAYLRRSVVNNHRTTLRSGKREVLGNEETVEIAARGGRQPTGQTFEWQDYEWAANEIENELIPKICLRLRSDAAESMRRSWGEMWLIASGESSVEALVLEQGGDGLAKDDEEFKKRRNALYQRHSRARRRILEWASRLRRRGRLREVEADQIEAVIELTRRR
jgi:DNA-directed RNA polymerase specialized sigma24 family protein